MRSRSIWILKDGWWIVMRTMLPPLAMSFTFSTTLKALVESRPEVGSSRNSREGLWIMSIPIETLRLSPPDTPLLPSSPMYVCAVLCTAVSYTIKILLKIRQSRTRTWVGGTRVVLTCNPSWSRSSWTLCFLSALEREGGSLTSAANMKVSKTVNMGKSWSSCIT